MLAFLVVKPITCSVTCSRMRKQVRSETFVHINSDAGSGRISRPSRPRRVLGEPPRSTLSRRGLWDGTYLKRLTSFLTLVANPTLVPDFNCAIARTCGLTATSNLGFGGVSNKTFVRNPRFHARH